MISNQNIALSASFGSGGFVSSFLAPQPAPAPYGPILLQEQLAEFEEESEVDMRVEMTSTTTTSLPPSTPAIAYLEKSDLDKLITELPWIVSALNENKTIGLASGECFEIVCLNIH